MFMLDNRGAKNRKVTLNIKDVGSRWVRQHMYEEQDAFLVCYDVSSHSSFEKM